MDVLQGCHSHALMERMCPCKSFRSTERLRKHLMQNSQGSVGGAEQNTLTRKKKKKEKFQFCVISWQSDPPPPPVPVSVHLAGFQHQNCDSRSHFVATAVPSLRLFVLVE